MTSYGINPQASLMHPCSHELGQTLALGHMGGIGHSLRGIGYDGYNFDLIGDVSSTIRAGASFNDHSVIIIRA